jgi:hypothetical protein
MKCAHKQSAFPTVERYSLIELHFLGAIVFITTVQSHAYGGYDRGEAKTMNDSQSGVKLNYQDHGWHIIHSVEP